jgi:hypothetical protein
MSENEVSATSSTESPEVFVDTPEDSPMVDAGNDSGVQLSDEKAQDTAGKTETKSKAEAKVDSKPATGVADSTKDTGGKSLYTPEEVAGLLQTGGNVDTSRLSVEGQLLMKSFQRGYDEKFKALSEERKRFSEASQKHETPRTKLFNRFVSDPVTVTAEINSEIEKLEGVEPGDPEFPNARKLVAQLHAMKDEFRENRTNITEGHKLKEQIYMRADSDVHKAIPDWESKEPKLTEFALSLGLELDDIKIMSDPTIMGPRSVRFIKTINQVYDKMMAGATAEAKIVKKSPAPLGRAGSPSSEEQGGTKSLEKMSYAEYKAARMKEMAQDL